MCVEGGERKASFNYSAVNKRISYQDDFVFGLLKYFWKEERSKPSGKQTDFHHSCDVLQFSLLQRKSLNPI
jgi:hypothetical protein